MKIFKKVLIIVLLVAVYCNVGYYGGTGLHNARIKSLKGEQLNSFEKFLAGPSKWLVPSKLEYAETNASTVIFVSVLLWPSVLLIALGGWTIYGVIIAFNAIVWFFVYLFKLIFLGEFFRLIFSIPVYIYGLLIFAFVFSLVIWFARFRS